MIEPTTTERPLVAGPVRGLIRASLIFSLGAIAGKAIGIVLLPILTRLLSPDELGRVDIATTFATAVTVLAGFQLDVAVTRVYFDLPSGPPRRRILGTFLTLLAATTVPAVAIVILLRDVLSSVLFGSPAFAPLIVGAGLLVVGSVYRIAVLAIARTTGRASDYARLSGGSLVLSGILTVGLLVAWQATAISVVLAYALAFAITAIAGLVILRAEVSPSLSWADASQLMRFGLPLLPAASAAIAADLVNRTVLLQSTGPSEVAYLGVALRIASIAALALVSFQLAWQPRAYAIFGTDTGRRQIAAEGSAILLMLSALTVAIGAVTPELLRVLAGQSYEVAAPATSFALIAVLASAGFLVASMPSLLDRDSRSVGISMAVGVGVAIVVNLGLAPQYGSAGTAAAMALGQAVAFVLVAWLGRSGMHLPFRWPAVAATMGAASMLCVLFTALTIPLAVRLITGGAFVLAIALTNRPRHLLGQLQTLARDGLATSEPSRSAPDEPPTDSPEPDSGRDSRGE